MTGSKSRRARDRGSSAVEFSLVVAAMAAMILAVVLGVGQIVASALQDTCDQVGSAVGGDVSACAAPASQSGQRPSGATAGPGPQAEGR